MMKRVILALSASLGLAAIPVLAQTASTVQSEIKNAAGAGIGQVTATAAPRGVLLRVEARDLPPGWHGIHFHQKADCSDAAFNNSGGHVHGEGKPVHGLLNPDANDAGDLPNIHVGADGTVNAELYSTLAALREAGAGQVALIDADGAAVVIHANVDDHRSQPIGGAGARIACAELR